LIEGEVVTMDAKPVGALSLPAQPFSSAMACFEWIDPASNLFAPSLRTGRRSPAGLLPAYCVNAL
jgi:hypothetical protein